MQDRKIGTGNRPMICTPLVAADRTQLLAELSHVLAKNPDIIEWRADYFSNLADMQAVVALAREIKARAGDKIVIFTIRSEREGGQPIALTDRQVIELNAAICEQTDIEYIDCELSNHEADIKYLRTVATANKTRIIGSYHNFRATPDSEFIVHKLAAAEAYELDAAKVAVMPHRLEDVLTLLSATLAAKRRLTIPVITMSMGAYGIVSRMMGGVFGSAVTFAVGASPSAPGQVPIEQLKTVLTMIEEAMSVEQP